jgi:hypothetical protein
MGVKYLTDQGPSGLSIGYSSSDLISFYGVTPVVQPSGSTQGAAITTVGSAVTTTVITTASTSTSPFGYTSTVADAITSLVSDIRTAVNLNTTALSGVIALANKMRTDLIALGLIKGSA